MRQLREAPGPREAAAPWSFIAGELLVGDGHTACTSGSNPDRPYHSSGTFFKRIWAHAGMMLVGYLQVELRMLHYAGDGFSSVSSHTTFIREVGRRKFYQSNSSFIQN